MAQPNNNLQNGMQQNSIFDNIKNTSSNMWQNIKDGATIAADTIRYTPEALGELAKISPTSRDWGLRLGYAKEIWDYHKKKGNMPMSTISSDSQKDLQNNLYGSNLGYNNPNRSCKDLLDDRRTPNIRKANIR